MKTIRQKLFNLLVLSVGILLILPATLCGQSSPNGKIRVTPQMTDKQIIIEYQQQNLWIPICSLSQALSQASPLSTDFQEVSYKLPLGKKRNCANAYREATYALPDKGTITIRAYNDGVAWHKEGVSEIKLSSLKNQWLMPWTEPYEAFYPLNPEIKAGDHFGYPALFEISDDTFALLSESNVNGQCAASTFFATDHGTFELRPEISEKESNSSQKPATGWQTLIIGSLSEVVESTLINDNSAPCLISDTDWIEPGVASWIYWAYNHGSNDYNIIKRYVDMAAELHLPYVLIDAEWDEMDKLDTNEGKTIEDAVSYAVNQGVKPIIWYSSSIGWIDGAPGPKFRLNKPEDREKEFAWCESIGVKGVKIDFFSGDNNYNISYMMDLLESAARHHLLVNFHGVTIPRGWQRTYPNLVSMEAVYGAEWYNNRDVLTTRAASHNATLPFTRNVIGSMDYTPCAFTDSQHPHITTHAHELALTALFESGIQHLADRPESFLSQPQEVREYLTELVTDWDESLLLSGYPGSSVVMARRHGSIWYICGINGKDTPQQLTFSIGRLKQLGTHITLFADNKAKDNPWCITQLKNIPTTIDCLPRGGFVLVIK